MLFRSTPLYGPAELRGMCRRLAKDRELLDERLKGLRGEYPAERIKQLFGAPTISVGSYKERIRGPVGDDKAATENSVVDSSAAQKHQPPQEQLRQRAILEAGWVEYVAGEKDGDPKEQEDLARNLNAQQYDAVQKALETPLGSAHTAVEAS